MSDEKQESNYEYLIPKLEITTMATLNLRDILKRFPEQFKAGLKIGKNIQVHGQIDQVVIAGMGGSAFPAEILDLHLGPLPVRLESCRDYRIRVPLTSKTLVFASSFSGNTEETLSAFQQAVDAGAKVVAVTTGGQLSEAADKAGFPIAQIPEDPSSFQPRFGSGYFFSIYAGVLVNAGLITFKGTGLSSLPDFLKERMPSLERSGKRLAAKLINKIPLVYTSERYAQSVARITKIKFNENAKIPAFFNAFPELNHNEMQGFEYETFPFHFIILRDPNENLRTIQRMAIFKRQLQKKGYPVTIYDMKGKHELHRAFDALVLGDWASYYLAVNRNIDPMPVAFIEAFKQEMKKER